MSAPQLQGLELRISEDMVSVLDFLSRVQQGIEGGDWHYVLDKAGELSRAAQRLSDAAGYEIERKRSDPPARSAVVIAAVRTWSRRYAAGRALFPEVSR